MDTAQSLDENELLKAMKQFWSEMLHHTGVSDLLSSLMYNNFH